MITHLQNGEETSRSPAFQRIEKMKERKYRPLLPVAKHLIRIRALDFHPFFLNPVISSLGYLNLDAASMVKWMQGTFNQAQKSWTGRWSNTVTMFKFTTRFVLVFSGERRLS